MNHYENITIIANQIANTGKKPTVALIKAKLSSPAPLPQIIGTLRNWQHEPDNCTMPEPQAVKNSDEKDSEESTNNMMSAEQVNLAIENALAPIKAELAAVKDQLHQLNKSGS